MSHTQLTAPPGTGGLPPIPKDKPHWAPFWATIIVTFVLMAGPIALSFAAPPRAEGAIGVYEAVTITDPAAGDTASARFIAPEGWINTTDPDTPNLFAATSPDESVAFEVSLVAEAPDVTELLRERSPIGAAGSPVTRVDTDGPLVVDVLEYDLSAGIAVTQQIAACTTAATPSCLILTVERTTAAPAGSIPQPVLDLLQSAEIQA